MVQPTFTIIGFSLALVAKYIVGIADFLEHFLGVLVARVLVWMIQLRFLAKHLLDALLRVLGRYTQDVVIVFEDFHYELSFLGDGLKNHIAVLRGNPTAPLELLS
jgi:hypothetical protein